MTVLAGFVGRAEELGSLGRVFGAIGTQVHIGLAGVETAMVGIGVFFALLLASTRRPLQVADDNATVPVVAMSLLRRLPVFVPLPPTTLEFVAQTAVEVPVRAGERTPTAYE